MPSGLTPKVRLVRCPKCRKVLPELADVPLYKCGGCDTVLLAKNRKVDARSTSDLNETGAIQTKDESDHVSEYKETSSSSHDTVLPSSGERSLDEKNGRSQNESIDCSSEQDGVMNLTKNDSQQYESWVSNIEDSGIINKAGLSTELAQENEELSPLGPANSEVEVNDESTVLAGAESEVDNSSDSNFGSLSADKLLVATRESNLVVTAHMPARESIPADILVFSPNKQPEQPQKRAHCVLDHVMSTDTIDTTDFFSPSSELSSTLEYLSKSPTTRSSQAYDGSVSSYDGRDDQFHDQQTHSCEKTYGNAGFGLPEQMLRKDKSLMNCPISNNPKMQKQAGNFSSPLPGKKDYAMKCGQWDQDELLKPSRLGHPIRKWSGLQGDEYQSQGHLFTRGSSAAYESGGAFSQFENEFHCGSGIHSIEMSEYAGQDRLDLLRMVYELQDQLNKTNFLRAKPSGKDCAGASWKGKHSPIYYDYEALEQQYHDFNYPRYHGNLGLGSSMAQVSEFSGRPFSGGPTNGRHQVDPSCLCCHPQDWQCSAQLPMPVIRHDKGYCKVHLGHNCYNSYSSCPSSPKRYMDSEFARWRHEMKAANQRHRDHEGKQLRERPHVVKRHLRPTAGGAPFITCYCCLKPLQLPADFLLFRRRSHRLRCGACSEVLKFSLENRTHIAPCTPHAVEPEPRNVNDHTDTTNNRNLASTSSEYDRPHADPVSYSDDYGLSFGKSCSTDGDPISLAPVQNFQGNEDAKNVSSDSSGTLRQRGELSLKQSKNKYKTRRELLESTGSSFNSWKPEKVSSEIEELVPPRGSPLHRLMGYSSPSQVIKGSEWSASGRSSCHPGKNLFSEN